MQNLTKKRKLAIGATVIIVIAIIVAALAFSGGTGTKEEEITKNFIIEPTKNKKAFDMSLDELEAVLNRDFKEYFNGKARFKLNEDKKNEYTILMKKDLIFKATTNKDKSTVYDFRIEQEGSLLEDDDIESSGVEIGRFFAEYINMNDKKADAKKLFEKIQEKYEHWDDEKNEMSGFVISKGVKYSLYFGAKGASGDKYIFYLLFEPSEYDSQESYEKEQEEIKAEADAKKAEEEAAAAKRAEEEAAAAAQKAEEEAAAASAAKAQDIANRTISLGAGEYVVGTDIEPGLYDIIATSGSGNMIVKGSTGRLSVNEVMGTDRDTNLPSYSNARLERGGTIKITSRLIVTFQAK